MMHFGFGIYGCRDHFDITWLSADHAKLWNKILYFAELRMNIQRPLPDEEPSEEFLKYHQDVSDFLYEVDNISDIPCSQALVKSVIQYSEIPGHLSAEEAFVQSLSVLVPRIMLKHMRIKFIPNYVPYWVTYKDKYQHMILSCT